MTVCYTYSDDPIPLEAPTVGIVYHFCAHSLRQAIGECVSVQHDTDTDGVERTLIKFKTQPCSFAPHPPAEVTVELSQLSVCERLQS